MTSQAIDLISKMRASILSEHEIDQLFEEVVQGLSDLLQLKLAFDVQNEFTLGGATCLVHNPSAMLGP